MTMTDQSVGATDVLSPDQRRRCMAHNRGNDTGPELALRSLCWAIGLRYRLKTKLIGKPDFVFLRERVAVFIDGCFWHGCPIHYSAPTTRRIFWREKLEANQKRDAIVTKALAESGWLVLRFWEHELKNEVSLEKQSAKIKQAVMSRRYQL